MLVPLSGDCRAVGHFVGELGAVVDCVELLPHIARQLIERLAERELLLEFTQVRHARYVCFEGRRESESDSDRQEPGLFLLLLLLFLSI